MNHEDKFLMCLPLAKVCEILYNRTEENNETTDCLEFQFSDCKFRLSLEMED